MPKNSATHQEDLHGGAALNFNARLESYRLERKAYGVSSAKWASWAGQYRPAAMVD